MQPTNTIDLGGKSVIVTGGTQGLGEAVARQAAVCGAKAVTICGRNADRGEKVRRELEKLGTKALYVEADLATESGCRNVVREHVQKLGTVDGLANVAASTARGTLEETTVAEWDAMFALNVRAPFLLMQESVRVMQRDKHGGSIVNIGSVSGHGGQSFLAAYSTSKGALNVLTKNAAHAMRKHKIRVNCLNIGWMATPAEHAVQLSEGKPENWLELADKSQPFGRIIRPEEVAKMTCYLFSDAAFMMTGSLIDFDQIVIGARE
jgi:NAD(P)-dependent dehydrogenase (short-subunit alcohol dehydrogenase family)